MFQNSSDAHISIETIYLEMRISLYKYAYHILKNTTDAEDAVQTALIKFIRAYEKICTQPKHVIQSYLKVIVKNECINILRSKKTK